jgi:gliding motility-associated-like protein
MKKWFFIIAFLCTAWPALARHVAGGELFYEYLGSGGSNISRYKVTLRLFRECSSPGPQLQNENVIVGVYENNNLVQQLPLPLIGSVETISLNTGSIPCLVGNPDVCYQVAIYSAETTLPINTVGYTLSRTGCCRVDNIANLAQATSVGSNYVTKIPGTATLPVGFNSSPQFALKDTALVCSNKGFMLDFSAQDPDGDVLTYSFCDAYTGPGGGGGGGGTSGPPAQTLTLTPLPYGAPYNGSSPLGGSVNINPTSGIINGIAPGVVGRYVVNVCITEWRNGVPFTEHRKDFILKVQDCDVASADLPDKIIQCDDFTVNFQNQSNSSSIISYLWNLGDGTISNQPNVLHTYADTGRYKASLFITGPNGCTGADSTIVIVYPGFTANFGITGSCYQTPFLFQDQTTAAYGFVNSWSWNFGDLATLADTSHQKNPSYQYASPGNVNVSLFVTSSKGCEKTITKPVVVRDKPEIILPFRDTLICSIDSLQLIAQGLGNFSWLPNNNIINANTATPTVFPHDTATYYVTLTQLGCVNTDSIKVNVLQYITVNAGLDSTICKTDTFRLRPTSYALAYQWTASTGEVVAPTKYPLVQPLSNTFYYVKANLGKCEAKDTVLVKVAPYPISNAGADTSICFGTKGYLHGNIVGSSFNWSPTNNMLNANTLNPIVAPAGTTLYILTVKDTLGCPKPVRDTIQLTVIKPVTVFAGNDTAIVLNQPLQLNAISNFDNGTVYKWTPSVGLNNTDIANPIAILNIAPDSIKYKVRATIPESCYGEDEIVVRLFKTNPDIFVPSGFTPNADGKNDLLKPIPVGISKLAFFSIYNRWGQLLYTTNEMGKGWDGKVAGILQDNGTYVYMTEGIDYTGKTIYRKGTVVLIK